MSSTAIIAQGITIARMGTTAFETIPNVVSFQGPGGQAQVIDVTNLSSTAKEKRMGLRDEGSLSLTLHFDPDNTVHDGLRTDRPIAPASSFASRLRTLFRRCGPFTAMSPSSACKAAWMPWSRHR